MASETTAAQAGKVGIVRRDPFAMLPFCGYNMADYFAHWLRIRENLESPPRIFHVNWFRQDATGRFLWPGFGENLRVLLWILERCNGNAEAVDTPTGRVPAPGALDLTGLDLSPADVQELTRVDRSEWQREADDIEEFFARFGSRLPRQLREQLAALRRRLSGAAPTS